GTAEGPVLKKSFTVDALPREAVLALSVAHHKRDEQDKPRTEVRVNGAMIDSVDRHWHRSSAEYRRLRFAIPADVLRKGTNTLELRQPAEGHCLVRGIVLELVK